ncbi:hypothetical protein EVAR_58860_1 [Eumeta japonica]|uniref:Uncharacterized protein n=1 Tax=Eumeta variegata TaxID=151549 RepID=A0A4C1Y8W5_EUMVA|nr:hypothetical protein EVAR_58860_1 [Eumeta japonica]
MLTIAENTRKPISSSTSRGRRRQTRPRRVRRYGTLTFTYVYVCDVCARRDRSVKEPVYDVSLSVRYLPNLMWKSGMLARIEETTDRRRVRLRDADVQRVHRLGGTVLVTMKTELGPIAAAGARRGAREALSIPPDHSYLLMHSAGLLEPAQCKQQSSEAIPARNSTAPTPSNVGCCARGRPIIVEWERDARHSAGLSLVRVSTVSTKRDAEAYTHLVYEKSRDAAE